MDHFIPWSRYPIDLGHNLVLAHEECNRRKSDHLAAEGHLERWTRRNEDLRYELPRVLDQAGVTHDLDASVRIAGWAYRAVAERHGLVWEHGNQLVPLGPRWERYVARAPG